MGGHGGLNILPHKSWNPYGWKQRQRVALDEERAEAKAREEAGARGRDAMETLRARKRNSESQSRASGHVNLFAEEERALEEAAKRDADAAKMLDESHRLGGRARADAPWYAQRRKRNAKGDESSFLIDDAPAEPAGRRRGRDGAGKPSRARNTDRAIPHEPKRRLPRRSGGRRPSRSSEKSGCEGRRKSGNAPETRFSAEPCHDRENSATCA